MNNNKIIYRFSLHKQWKNEINNMKFFDAKFGTVRDQTFICRKKQNKTEI